MLFFLVVDIIRIGHITSYLYCNVLPVIHSFILVVDIILIGYIIHSFVLVMDIICIDHIKSYLAHNVHPIFHIYSSSVNDWCVYAYKLHQKLLILNQMDYYVSHRICIL